MGNLERWNVNETLLQSYRSIFISSQSFLLAVGVILLDKSDLILLFISILSLVMIWVVWFPVVVSRHKIVDFYKYQAKYPDKIIDCREEVYVHDLNKRKQVNAVFELKTNWRETRKKLDLYLPIMFSLVWILLGGIAFYKIVLALFQ